MKVTIDDYGHSVLKEDNGSLIMEIGENNACYADLNERETTIAITYKDGRVIIYSSQNSIICFLVNKGAEEANFRGADVMVKMNDGQYTLYSINGSMIASHSYLF
jgi:predicted ribosome-associated RNA-binding protein Tma20